MIKRHAGHISVMQKKDYLLNSLAPVLVKNLHQLVFRRFRNISQVQQTLPTQSYRENVDVSCVLDRDGRTLQEKCTEISDSGQV